mmetsp:Transcript_14018/g.30517  ORF Transcript_14018/g.30517 Transcript_14018/m.30517 type:complete len:105 (-) Transcript_14018:890-1204(-)
MLLPLLLTELLAGDEAAEEQTEAWLRFPERGEVTPLIMPCLRGLEFMKEDDTLLLLDEEVVAAVLPFVRTLSTLWLRFAGEYGRPNRLLADEELLFGVDKLRLL